MAYKTYTRAEVVDLFREAMGDKSVREMAEEMKVSETYLYDVLKGDRNPGPSMLAYLGLDRRVERTVVYHTQLEKRRA